jgi:hypothetical protein
LTAELIEQLKAGKLDILIATKKLTRSDDLVGQPNAWNGYYPGRC